MLLFETYYVLFYEALFYYIVSVFGGPAIATLPHNSIYINQGYIGVGILTVLVVSPLLSILIF